MTPIPHEIIFRRLDAPVPSWCVPGVRWVVEFYDAGNEHVHPVGQAWVFDAPCPEGQEKYVKPYLDWVKVDPEYRRRGVGTLLVEAALRRWPDLRGDWVTDEGEHLLRKFPSVWVA